MEEKQTTETTEVPEMTAEQQMNSMKSLAAMQHKAGMELVDLHLSILLADVNDTRSNQKTRLLAAIAIREAMKEALDYGVGLVKPKSKSTGAFAKKAANLGGVLAKTLDNRMLLIALNEQNNKNNEEEKVEQEGEQENV